MCESIRKASQSEFGLILKEKKLKIKFKVKKLKIIKQMKTVIGFFTQQLPFLLCENGEESFVDVSLDKDALQNM